MYSEDHTDFQPSKKPVLPNREDEILGLRTFIKLSGLGEPERMNTGAGTFDFKSIIDRIMGRGDSDALVKLIALVREQDPDSDLLTQIRIDHLPGPKVAGSTDQSIADVIRILDQFPETAPASEIIRIIFEETKELVVGGDDILNVISLGMPKVNPMRAVRLATALGIPPSEIEGRSLDQLLAYLSDLSKRVDELQDFEAAETSFQVTRHFLPEIRMLDRVTMQTGVECVLYASYNLAQAALAQGADIKPVDITEMQQRIPQGEGTRYRTFGGKWLDYMAEKGFDVHADFNWGEAIKLMEQRKGGLFMRIFADHAVAVVGVRHTQEQPPELQFLVANSLENYWPIAEKNEPVWVRALELISKAQMLKAGEDTRHDIYLLTWDF